MGTENLLEQFLSKANFLEAYRRISQKKAVGGLDGVTVETFGHRLDYNIQNLQKQIRERRYLPQPASVVPIPKFNAANEWRQLGLPTVTDKIVQAALLQVVEPIAEKTFIDCSYAYRPGKGHFKAIRRVEHVLHNRKKSWALQRDIDNFFDTLSHNRLINQFSDLVHGDPILVELVALWCRMGLAGSDGRWRNIQSGIRQGHIISPLLSNLYLTPLDHFATQLGIDWIRYADNYLILADSKEALDSADARIESFLKETLALRLNQAEEPAGHIHEGFTFLGIRFCGDTRSIEPKKMEKIKRKIAWHLSPKNKNPPEKILSKLFEMTRGWQQYYGFLNPTEQFAEIEGVMEKAFLNHLVLRIKEGRWEKTPPIGHGFPLLSQGNPMNNKESNKLTVLWKQAVHLAEEPLKGVLNAVQKKVAKRKRSHDREQSQSGNLVVTTPGYFIGKRGERIIVRDKERIVAEMAAIRLEGLTLSKNGVSLSADVVDLCVQRGIYIHFVDNIGKVCAVVGPPGGSSGETSLRQVTERSREKGLALARLFIIGKVKNQLSLLKYYFKYSPNRLNGFGHSFVEKKPYMEGIVQKIKEMDFELEPDLFRQRLMGLEGTFAAAYWEVVKHLFRSGITFSGRVRQGATDIVNVSLNYGYGVLYSRCFNAVIQAGLNPMTAFLHSDQPGQPVLIYDLIEEFRAPVVDRTIFTFFNRGEPLLQGKDGLLLPESRKKIAGSVINALGREVVSGGRRQTLGHVIKDQADHVKKYLFGTAKYHPYLSRW